MSGLLLDFRMEEQHEEIEVLESIYDHASGVLSVEKENSKFHRGTVQIHPILPEPFRITSCAKGSSKSQATIKYLPPMNLHFKYVGDYPSLSPPAFLLACQWLTLEQLSKLSRQMDLLWEEFKPDVVLFRWMNFLQDEALKFLQIDDTLDISPLVDHTANLIEVQFSPPSTRKEVAPKASSRPKKVINQSEKTDTTRFYNPKQRGVMQPRRPRYPQSVKEKMERNNSIPKATRTKMSEPPKKPQPDSLSPLLRRKPSAIFRHPMVQNSLKDTTSNLDTRVVLQLVDGSELLSKIIEYNERRKQEAFDKEWFTCKVCMTDRQGSQGLRFQGCDHVFCKDCMRSFFNVQIKDGNVQSLTCPEDKCLTQALPHQVYELVGKDLYTRYDKILLDSTLSQMTDITTCPRVTCQCFIMLEQGSNAVSCPACKYISCLFCRKTYHGLEPCRFRHEEKKEIREKYINSSYDEKLKMEKRYGKKEILAMVSDSLSEQWVESFSKKCPHCCAAIEKSDGCNKMTCWRCNTIFCWLCNQRLSPTMPYQHYNDRKSPCFNHLFHGMPENSESEDSDDDDWQFGEFL